MQPTNEQVPARTWITVIGVLLGAFMAVLDIQITNASLKDIQGTLSASVDEISWVSTAYLVAEIIVIPLTGWLSRVFSTRYYLAVNSALFICFSVLSGLARTLTMMIVWRALQGFTGGVLGAEQRIDREGSSPSGARMRSAVSKSGDNTSLAGESGRYGEA